MTLRVEANRRFAAPAGAPAAITREHYSIAAFDIRPYLPDDTGSALHRVLQRADWLAGLAAEGVIGDQPHQWAEANDEDNLRLGVDCSRALWFAFTCVRLEYSKSNRHLPVASMIGPESPMSEQFDACDPELGLRPGDILVYQDDDGTCSNGHVVMVIDPEKRIAWGSRPPARNTRPEPTIQQPDETDNGPAVEYQLIRYRQDWQRLSGCTMTRKACWRHRAFASAGQQPGLKALDGCCDQGRACGR
jgi:hypothetical protein